MSDTLRVILRGRLVTEVDPRHVTPSELGEAMTGVNVADTDSDSRVEDART